jgi:hypothetical protein
MSVWRTLKCLLRAFENRLSLYDYCIDDIEIAYSNKITADNAIFTFCSSVNKRSVFYFNEIDLKESLQAKSLRLFISLYARMCVRACLPRVYTYSFRMIKVQ